MDLSGSPITLSGSFSTSLKWEDRQRLRAVVRRVHLRFMPKELLTDLECDKFIDAMGPKVAQATIERAMKRGLIE
jgi:hypothetical protein